MRLGIYFVPDPGTALYQMASSWLGYDIRDGRELIYDKTLLGINPQHRELVAPARRYGFHATLKAPFRLRDGEKVENIAEALHEFSGRFRKFTLPSLKLQTFSSFSCLVPERTKSEINEIADQLVRDFDKFRSPPTQEELDKRMAKKITTRQLYLLRQWGYPYVLDCYRFHMTLTGTLPSDPVKKNLIQELLERYFEPIIEEPVCFNTISLVCEPEPESCFVHVQQFPLGVN